MAGEAYSVMHSFGSSITRERALAEMHNCWEAAPLNPSWDPDRFIVTARLFSVGFGEGCFDPKAIGLNNNGTVDFGGWQENLCHVWPTKDKKGRYRRSEWERFCVEQGLDPHKLALLFDNKINVKFAAHLNEIFIKNHQGRYKYYNNPGRVRIYDAMKRALVRVRSSERFARVQ
jgi:hypothetical protein